MSSRHTIHDNYTSLAAYSSPLGGEQRVSDCYNVDKYGKLAVFSSRIWQPWPPGSRGDSQRRGDGCQHSGGQGTRVQTNFADTSQWPGLLLTLSHNGEWQLAEHLVTFPCVGLQKHKHHGKIMFCFGA